MIEKLSQIPELYELKHRHDDQGVNVPFDYENNLFSRLFSNVMFRNPILAGFLEKIQPMCVLMIEGNLLVRNWFNYTVNKYEK